MYETFTFDGIKKDWIYILEGRKKAPFPSMKRNTIDIPGVHGSYLESTDIEPLVIEQPFGFVQGYDWTSIKDELASWLFTNEPVPLQFPHEPGRTYYAVVQNTIDDFERVNRTKLMQGTITFLCLDPYAYGTEQTVQLSSTIANEGTAEAYPVFDLTVKEDTELIRIGNKDNLDAEEEPRSLYIGTQTDIDDDKEEKKRLVLHDTMQSTSAWEGASDVDSGEVTGQMEVDEEGFYVDDYGEDDDDGMSATWIGPSLKRNLDDPLDSFIADVYIENHNSENMDGLEIDNGVGIIEVYFRDINGEMVAKAQFGDTSDATAVNHYVFVTGGKKRKIQARKPSGWNNFNGQLRITRDSGYFYPKLTKINDDDIRMEWLGHGTVIPGPGTGSHEVTTIQVAIRKWIGAQRIYQRIKEMKVWSVVGFFDNDKKKVEKFEEGDTIHINTGTGMVRVNGEERLDLQHFDSEMFSLVEGINKLDYNPDKLEGTVTFRNRYL